MAPTDGWQAPIAEQRNGFAPLCPDLLVELASASGERPRDLTALRQKMAVDQRTGAGLSGPLMAAERTVEIWDPLVDPPVPPRRMEAAGRREEDPDFHRLQVELEEIWAG